VVQYTLIPVATYEQVQHVFWGTMSVVHVSFPMAIVTYCTVGAALNNAVYKYIICYLFGRSKWTPIFILSHANWLTRHVRNSV